MNVMIRRASIDDLDALVPLFDGYRRFYEQESAADSARRFLAERLQNDEAVVFLAESAGVALGFTLLYPMFSSVGMRRVFILNDLFVAPAGRQMGIGRALLDAAADFGRRAGAASLQLETHKTNTVAQALYVAQGWKLDQEFLSFHLALPVTTPPILPPCPPLPP